MIDEEPSLMISALQHALYCERQFALIHLEQLWEENLFTVEGQLLHTRKTMDSDARKTALVAYQDRKQGRIYHPFIKGNVQLGSLFYIQANLLARHIQGDLDGYPPFIWR